MELKRVGRSALVLTFAVLGGFLLPVAPVDGLQQPPPGDNWAPVGPFVNEILIKHYATTGAEFLAFGSRDIDMTDWPFAPAEILPLLRPDSLDHVVSAPVRAFGFFDIQFNLANTHFGIPFNLGNNPAGDHIRMAVAHLIDKKAHVAQEVVQGFGEPIDNHFAPGQVPPGTSPIPDYHLFDPLHGPQTISAFNLVDDLNPAPAVDSPDWLAARDTFWPQVSPRVQS